MYFVSDMLPLFHINFYLSEVLFENLHFLQSTRRRLLSIFEISGFVSKFSQMLCKRIEWKSGKEVYKAFSNKLFAEKFMIVILILPHFMQTFESTRLNLVLVQRHSQIFNYRFHLIKLNKMQFLFLILDNIIHFFGKVCFENACSTDDALAMNSHRLSKRVTLFYLPCLYVTYNLVVINSFSHSGLKCVVSLGLYKNGYLCDCERISAALLITLLKAYLLSLCFIFIFVN